MTLVPSISGTPYRDSSYITLADLTGLYNSLTNLGGYSNFVARVAGTITISTAIVTLTGHGLTNSHKILITDVTDEGDIRIRGIYDVNVLSSSTFNIRLNGTNLEFASDTSRSLDYVQCLSPINKGLAGIDSIDINVQSLKDSWTKTITYNSESPIYFPVDESEVALTLEDLGLTAGNYPDGIYLISGKMWFPMSRIATVSGSLNAAILAFSSPFTITNDESVFVPLSNLTGGGDTTFIKVVNLADTDRYVITTINEDDSAVNSLVVNDTLVSIVDSGSINVDVLIGYSFSNYFIVNNGTIQCLSSKLSQVKVSSLPSCKSCGSTNLDCYTDIYTGLIAVNKQAELGLYDEANKNLQALSKICLSNNCNCNNVEPLLRTNNCCDSCN